MDTIGSKSSTDCNDIREPEFKFQSVFLFLFFFRAMHFYPIKVMTISIINFFKSTIGCGDFELMHLM